jgi:glycosyltransferase involved in cell wall biosynthesis
VRILYLTQWFEPEPNVIKGLKFVRALQDAGRQVEVVTGFPNYPSGRLYPGYRLQPLRRETLEGVSVTRLALYPSHDSSSLRRSLNYLSFFASALAWLLLRRRRFDLAYVYHPPITVGLAAALAGVVRPLPFVLDIQDLWPDTLAATGMPGAGRLTGLVNLLCHFVYRRAAGIVVQSEGMRLALIARGVPSSKLSAIRNWADLEAGEPADPAPRPQDRFVVVYGGNLGRAQGLGTVLDAAARLQQRRPEVLVRLYGEGIEAAALRAQAGGLGLTNLEFHPRIGKDDIARVFAGADALLLHLADDPLFAVTIPSKTQAYLASGRPIVAGVAGEAAELLGASGAALVAPPGDAEALARAVEALVDMPAEDRRRMGLNGQDYYRRNLAFERGVDRTLELLAGTHRT